MYDADCLEIRILQRSCDFFGLALSWLYLDKVGTPTSEGSPIAHHSPSQRARRLLYLESNNEQHMETTTLVARSTLFLQVLYDSSWTWCHFCKAPGRFGPFQPQFSS